MSQLINTNSVPLARPGLPIPRRSFSWFFSSLFLVLSLSVAASIPYKLRSSEQTPLHVHRLARQLTTTSKQNSQSDNLLQPWEMVGVGALEGPEDLAYDSRSRLIHTGCADGWIKRVTVNKSAADSVIKNWVNTGGRPLGIAFGLHNEVLVADTEKGLLNVSRRGKVEVLTNETKLIDSVVMAKNGMVYFTEASYKYGLHDFLLDITEGKPHGRLWSYNPATKRTKVLLRNLYFANGLAVSPDQSSVIFCETTKKRCRRYFIQGKKKGHAKKFVDLPGFPDNIQYEGSDSKGHYWIALAMTYGNSSTTAGVLVVDKQGNPVYQYFGLELSLISTGIKIGNHLYCGSLVNPYMIRLNLQEHSEKQALSTCNN
ncbi:Strictosidine synthase [Parasponia andersonii]|uniref:Strictosidine synthase n=1 Tax=Parasponia andersonii TaxID=3476 RepID=A0A2P5BMH3_PARAD|nr:Strictosidine synthase [Parasponia andersonii]